MQAMLRVMIAEDHSLVRDGLRLYLSAQPDIRLVAETDDGCAVLPLVLERRPDLLLLDLGLPGIDGLEVMAALARENLPTRVLVVTARLDAASVKTSLALGAAGYLPKSEDADALLAAMHRIAAGEIYVSPEVAALFETDMTVPGMTETLTAREREVLALVGKGLSSKEIARRLGISDLTVRKHRENLCRKLGARNAPELVACALRLGL
jgi:DNA-binding NarL/FixJ family response regulator